MGLKKYIPGLKPKSSTNNLVVPVHGGAYQGDGYGGGFHSNAPGIGTKNAAQANIYSIPEVGAAAPQQHHHQIPGAIRPGPQSFEASRSTSSGSGYSYSNSTNSLGKSSVTTTSTSGGSGIRHFSGASTKSNSTAATVRIAMPVDPQISAADVRRCTKLLRQMFELHLELWALTNTHETDQPIRLEKRRQVDAILVDIRSMVDQWHNLPPSTWTEDEYAGIKWVVQTLEDLPPPPY